MVCLLPSEKKTPLIPIPSLPPSLPASGIRIGAYPGLSASILRQMTYSLTRFGVYDALKSKFSEGLGENESLPAWKMAIAASIAGGLGGIAGNPADIVLVRMTGDRMKEVGKRLEYRNWLVVNFNLFEIDSEFWRMERLEGVEI